jgi:hypothetical protein
MEENKKMEENKNAGSHPEGCRCMLCRGCGGMGKGKCCFGMCGGGHRFIILRIIIGIIILIFVFALGVKLGELKASLVGSSYGYPTMGGGSWGYGRRGMMYQGNGYGPGMMNRGGWGTTQQQSTTTLR